MNLSTNKLARFRRKILAGELAPGYLTAIGSLYLEQQENDIDVLKAVAALATQQNDPVLVDRCCSRLIELGVEDEDVILRQLETVLKLAKIEEGRKLSARALEAVTTERGLAMLHRVSTGVGAYDVSLQATQRMLDIDRSDPARWSGYATALQHAGDLAGAESAYRKSLELNGRSPLTRFLLSACRRYDTGDNNIEALRSAIAGEQSDSLGWQHLVYALAKELEDTEQYDESFEWLAKGAASVRKSIDFTIETDRRMCVLLRELYGLPGSDGVPAARPPIFILGMPRTGSTLVERILSSHTRVVSQGETNGLLSSLRLSLGVPQANTIVFQRLVSDATHVDYGTIGQRYLDYVEPRSVDCDFFVEKLPQNVFLAGLVLRSFTEAKIIYTDRNPMDTCFSNFKQLFNPGYFPYSYDLKETAQQYELVREFAQHWCEHDPERVTMVNYDDLVRNPQAEIRRLLEFLGLDVEEACFSPEKNTAGLATASFSQARKPIYRSSSEKWRKFDKHLGELKSYFGIE